jgi:hypothetical protein
MVLLEIWINERGGVEAHEDHQAVEAIRGFIQTNQHRLMRPTLCSQSDVVPSDTKWTNPSKPIGYFLEEEGLFAIFPQTWKDEACAGLDSRQVAERLVTAGYLHAEMSKGRISKAAKKVTVGDERQRLVCIRAAILTISGEERENDVTLKTFNGSEHH